MYLRNAFSLTNYSRVLSNEINKITEHNEEPQSIDLKRIEMINIFDMTDNNEYSYQLNFVIFFNVPYLSLTSIILKSFVCGFSKKLYEVLPNFRKQKIVLIRENDSSSFYICIYGQVSIGNFDLMMGRRIT